MHDGTLSVRKKSKPSFWGRIRQTKSKWYNYGATWKQMTLCWTYLPKPESRNESLSLIVWQIGQLTPHSNANSLWVRIILSLNRLSDWTKSKLARLPQFTGCCWWTGWAWIDFCIRPKYKGEQTTKLHYSLFVEPTMDLWDLDYTQQQRKAAVGTEILMKTGLGLIW